MTKSFEVFRLSQNGRNIFIGFLRTSDVLNSKTIVDAWTTTPTYLGRGTGYQRLLSDQKLKKIRTFLTKNKGILPMSVLVGIRGNVRFVAKSRFAGKIQVADDAELYIVDGQHRIRGLELALKVKGAKRRLRGFAFPAVFLCPTLWDKKLKPEVEEGKQFVTINKTQTGVKGDLVDAFVYSLLKPENLKPKFDLVGLPDEILREMGPRTRARAITVLLKEWVPWHNLIRGPNENRGDTLLNEKALVDSLTRDVIRNPKYAKGSTSQLAVHLTHYWEAVMSFYPGAQNNPKHYWVQKLLGMAVFNILFPRADLRIKVKTPISYRKVLLAHAKMPGVRFWGNKGKARQLSTSYSSRDNLAERIWP